MKKIKNAFSGVIVGILFIALGIGLLWWNEGNNVKNIKTIEEAKAGVVDISNDKVDSTNDGKLVSTNGTLNIVDEYLLDSVFNVKSPKSLKMVRIVEMYQWEEDTETRNDETVYVYERVWSSELIDSDFFNDKARTNPSTMPYSQEKFLAKEVTLGAFTISDVQKDKLSTKKTVILDENITIPDGYKKHNNYITNSTNPDSPAIGDVRISFFYNDDTVVSVLAKQSGNTFVNYVSEQNKVLNEIVSGTFTGAEIIGQVESQNNMLKIILRIVGVIFVMVGFCGLCSPISNLISIVPLFGKHISGFINAIAMLVGLAVSFVVIAIAWIRFRPIVGICLLAAVVLIVGLVLFLIIKSRKKAKEQPVPGVLSSSQSETINQQFNQSDSTYNQNLNYASIVDASSSGSVSNNQPAASNGVVQPVAGGVSDSNQQSNVQTPVQDSNVNQQTTINSEAVVGNDQNSVFEQLQNQAVVEAQEEDVQKQEVQNVNVDDVFAQFQNSYVEVDSAEQQSDSTNIADNK